MTDEAEGIPIPDKVFFRIGEVAALTEVKAYVLRYWESEFPLLAPQKGRTGQRRYRRTDIELILRIKELLWERKFTIAGARTELRGARDRDRTQIQGQQALPIEEPEPPQVAVPTFPGQGELLRELRADLVALRRRVRRLARDPE